MRRGGNLILCNALLFSSMIFIYGPKIEPNQEVQVTLKPYQERG